MAAAAAWPNVRRLLWVWATPGGHSRKWRNPTTAPLADLEVVVQHDDSHCVVNEDASSSSSCPTCRDLLHEQVQAGIKSKFRHLTSLIVQSY